MTKHSMQKSLLNSWPAAGSATTHTTNKNLLCELYTFVCEYKMQWYDVHCPLGHATLSAVAVSPTRYLF